MLRPIGVSGGHAPRPQVIHGNMLHWLIREGMSVRMDPAPSWANSKRVVGIPLVEQTPNHALTLELTDDIDVQPEQFSALGIYVGAIMNVVRDHEILSEHQARSEFLIDALRALPTASTEDDIAHQLILAARRIAGAGGAAVARWDGEHGVVIHSEGGVKAGATFEGTQSLSSLGARGSATIVREGSALRAMKIVTKDERLPFTPHSALVIPLAAHGQVAGVLTVWSIDPIAEAAITALETIAPYAAAQLEHARELGFMRSLAERDALTGLHNRRSFDEHLNAEVARFDRYRRPFALVMMDIDHFKSVNDQYGHDAGDAVLRRVGQVIATSLRDVDVAARYGGEEFALLLPETDKTDALEIAERIRKRIAEAPVEWRGQSIAVTSSAGVAAIPERNVDVTNVVRVADQLLYEAKRQGRNRVVTIR